MKRLSLTIILLAIVSAAAFATEKLTEVNGVKFGWKYDRCVEAIGDVPRKLTNTDGDETKFYYSPAIWGRIDWDRSVLDFYQDKLYQIGFYKASATDDRTAFEQAKVILSAAYGKSARLKGEADKLMWRSSNGNIAVLQYVVENDETANPLYGTYLFFVDNKEVVKKAKKVESELREMMYGK